MKQFWLKICGFSIPLLLGIGYLFWVDIDPAESFRRLEYDCRNGNWMYKRLYQNPTPIDIALLGSSRMMCGVNDSLLAKYLQAEPLIPANFGFCRFGRNLHYDLAQKLIANKNPKYFIIEIREQEDPTGHIDFPYLASGDDFSRLNLKEWANAFEFRAEYLRRKILSFPAEKDTVSSQQLFSFNYQGNVLVCREETQNRAKKALKIAPESALDKFSHQVTYRSAHQNLRKIYQLSQESGAELIFLYLPNYHSHPDQKPIDQSFYEEMGKVWLPPQSIFANPKNWADPNHMNEPGAEAITRWLSEEISKMENR